MTVCLDSWAVLAWLDGDEPAAAAARGATLYTGDAGLLERDVGCRTRDLRPRAS